MAEERLDPQSDPFRPPDEPVEVSCIHCGQTYDSNRIEWREHIGADGELRGFWCCPIPGCDGIGFGFDILPTDPTYRDERGGWFEDDYDEDEFDDDEEDDFEDDDFEDDDLEDEFDPADLEDSRDNPLPPRSSGSNGNGRKYDFPNDDIPF